MKKEKKNLNNQMQDINEMIKLMNQLSQEDRRETRGFMLGLSIGRQRGAEKTA